MNVVISSGHGKYVRGASGYLDEVDEARKVVNRVAECLAAAGVGVFVYHDDVSRTQNENLKRIVDYHNSKVRELDASVHFNAYQTTPNPMGTECLYVTQATLAGDVAANIARAAGLTNRGGKKRTDLYFLNNTAAPAILIEICFVDSTADADLYRQHFEGICQAIADTIAPSEDIAPTPTPEFPVTFSGTCSWFGGPEDDGVAPDEGLAFIYSYEQRPELFLPQQPPGTTGLARRLDPDVFYVACRWDYSVTSKEMLADPQWHAIVRANGQELRAWPADWGPHEDTGRAADLSPGLMNALGIETDDAVEVIYPAPAQPEPQPEPATVAITTTGAVRVTVNGEVVVDV